ncbi:MAG: sporulation protein YabP [Lachnospiraceae bacterium]
MEDLNVNYNGKQIRSHKVMLTNRKTCTISGVVDVLSFDTGEVLLETDLGMLMIKGKELHVSRLSLDKGEVDVEGNVDSLTYSDIVTAREKTESFFSKLFQ